MTKLRVLVFHMFCWLFGVVSAYRHYRCHRIDRAQFQLDDCVIPSHAEDLLFSQASFLMSHDAATGYIRPTNSKQGLVWPYAKNQIGTVQRQLNDGARALDLRPYLLQNGTVVFQHGVVTISVSLETVAAEVVEWCGQENHRDELVLVLASNFQYEPCRNNNGCDDNNDMASAMQAVYDKLGVAYLHCNDVYGLTMGQVKELAALPSGGYALALDGQDYYGTFCGKTNWVEEEIVTCWGGSTVNSTRSSCRTSSVPLDHLTQYLMASLTHAATDDPQTLGPPSDLYQYPLNEVQALWQVDTHAAAVGLAHLSSILEDNRQSALNRHMVEFVYNYDDGNSNDNKNHDDSDNTRRPISIFAMDNVALNGNAVLSVLRTKCGQASAEELDECGQGLRPPRLWYLHLPLRLTVRVLLALYLLWFVYVVWDRVVVRGRLFHTLRWDWTHRRLNHSKEAANDPLPPQTWEAGLLSTDREQAAVL